MSEILNQIIYCSGAVFITYIVVIIIGVIILKIKEITYDAHQNLIELNKLKRKLKQTKEEIKNISIEVSTDYESYEMVETAEVVAILDKLIESEE